MEDSISNGPALKHLLTPESNFKDNNQDKSTRMGYVARVLKFT